MLIQCTWKKQIFHKNSLGNQEENATQFFLIYTSLKIGIKKKKKEKNKKLPLYYY